MHKNVLHIAIIFILIGCAIPTSSINSEITPKNEYLFYINEEINLHANELLQTIQLPSQNYPVPEYLNLLPNALREYRSGTHHGIDFPIPLNGPIMAVSGGIIVRSNPSHNDVDIETYNAFLETTQKLSKTPEDIYNYILLGKSIVIDHGYSIAPNFRTISVYAHLAGIADGILPGTRVEKGQLIGFSGNTGTSSGALKNEKGAHLHWELYFEDDGGKYFLGQNIPPELLKENIDLLFE
ncbi:MAG: M23 family metallopeptidase [Candidatus Neomarinimicrobiota bacterium]|nr:M23 family metallopeptidase [Candidatus Neomarinimicrobiota bacterium]